MGFDRWSELLALFACVLGIVVVVVAWPRRTSDHRPAPVPQEPAPIAVKLDTIGDDARWRVANRHSILNVTIDIVTFRAADSDDSWSSEPIVEPVDLSPGRSTTLPTVIDDPSVTYDVAVAWTVHHLGDDRPGRRIFRVSPDGDPPAPPVPVVASSSDVRGLAAVYGIVAVLLCAGAVIAGWRLLEASDPSSGVTAAPNTAALDTAVPATTIAATTTDIPATVPPPTATAPTTNPPAPTTAPPLTTTPAPTTVPATTSPATTAPATTVVPPPILIRGRIDPCRFGPTCLIADFRLDGFPREGDYICEFADGSRFTFRYEGDGADDACSATGADASITIEVDGIRSDTITRTDLNDGA